MTTSTHRPVTIETNFNDNCPGSVLITMGKTKVICTAVIANCVPKFLRDKHQGWLTAEYSMLPTATSSRTEREAIKGKQQGRTVEIQRLIGRSLRSCLNLKLLPGHTITIDCDVIQADGGTRSAAITGGYVAMVKAIQNFQYRGIFKQDPVVDMATALSMGFVNGKPLVDLAYKEDQKADSDINLVLNSQLEIIEIQGTAEKKTFSLKQLQDLINTASPDFISLQAIQKTALDLTFQSIEV